MAGDRPRRRQGEGTVYFDDGRGRWVGQAWINNRRRKVSAMTERGAVEAVGRLIHGAEEERRAVRNMTVSQLLGEWHETALPGRNLSDRMMEQHRWAIDKLRPEIGKARIDRLDVMDVERALARIAKGSQGGVPLAHSSIAKVRSTLNQAYKWAQTRRMVAFNPAAVAELPHNVAPDQPRRALSPDELDALLVALRGHDLEWMFRASAQIALRPGEAAGLCVDALDFDAGTLSVIRGVQRKSGRPVLSDSLKTKAARRTLAMPASLADGLRGHIEANGTASGMLWSNSKGNPLWHTTMRKELAAVCESAGITPAARPNELRHTCATILANEHGVQPRQLADLLGHTSTKMVEHYYRHRPDVIRTTGLEIE